ncbi:MAG: alpha/beta fold hydrolase [Acetobacteraceae bacterium]|nr:alpha/beta fold hydrolase [Acetobacteraceae bacterium]
MSEEQVEVGGKGGWLAGVLHLPEGAVPAGGVVLCPGFPKSKAESDFCFVLAARRLSRRLAVLRFDYRGLGDSPGLSEDVTLARMAADARRSVAWLGRALGKGRGRPSGSGPAVALLGFGLGAAVAALAAGSAGDRRGAARDAYGGGAAARVGALVLWSPPFEPLPDHRRVLLPAGLEALYREGRVDMALLADWEGGGPSRDYFFRLGAEPKNACGLMAGRRLLEGLDGLDTLALARAAGLPLLVVTGSEAGPVLGPLPREGAEGEELQLHLVPGANHLLTHPRWKEAAIEATAAFLEARLGAEAGGGEGGG